VGLAALAAWARVNGHQVRVLDLDLDQRLQAQPGWPACRGAFYDAVLVFEPDVVAVTSMYSNSLQAERLIELAKSLDPAIVTLAGGSHFGALPVQSLKRLASLDFAIRGEAEGPLLALLAQLSGDRDWAKVPSLAWRDGDIVRLNPAGDLIDLGLLPNPWAVLEDVIPIADYIGHIDGAPIAYVEAGRGCPFTCSFCATAPFWDRRFRVKKPQQIIAEIRTLAGYGYEKFALVHDLLTVNRKFIAEFCEAMLESRLPVEWMANARTDLPLDGLLPLMKAAGCWKLFCGIESGSARIQSQISKELDLERSVEFIDSLSRHGLTSTCSFVVGFPDETAAELSRSLKLGARLKMLGAETVQFHRLRIWPPAPLSISPAARQFDRVSLEIEYPYLAIPDADLAAIERDPEFFGGYFPPDTDAAAPWKISQLEMFAHHAIALAPMTIYTLEALRPGRLAQTFFDTLDTDTPIDRNSLDLEGGDLERNWITIKQRLDRIADRLELQGPQRLLFRGVLSYEDRRIAFTQQAVASGEKRPTIEPFTVTVDIEKSIEAIISGSYPCDDLLTPTRIAFANGADGRHVAYTCAAPDMQPAG
jgi:radical SAM superfamily enzyme YgiQ (UPF0313 family)